MGIKPTTMKQRNTWMLTLTSMRVDGPAIIAVPTREATTVANSAMHSTVMVESRGERVKMNKHGTYCDANISTTNVHKIIHALQSF